MKSVIVILAAIILLFSCGNDGGKITQAPKKRTIDTSLVYGIYLGYARRGNLYGPLKRFIFDSVSIWTKNPKDSLEARMVWGKDSAYIGEMYVPINDSATAKAVGLKNWNGKDTVVRYADWINKNYVFDTGINWDSASAKLKPFMDTTYNKPKKDTAK